MNRTLRRIAPFFAAGLVVLGACSGGGSTSSNTVPADADVVVRAVDGIAWNQDEYSATAVDGKVKIYAVNDSGIAHDMYVKDGDTPVGDFIDLPRRGDDGALVYDLAPGEYRIVCLIPGHNNMDSTLVVK
jgi:plastocyanin